MADVHVVKMKNIEWENIEVSTIALPGGKEKAVGYESSLSTGIK